MTAGKTVDKARRSGGDAADRTGLRSPVGEVLTRARSAFVGIGVFSFFVNLLMLTGPIYMLQVYDRVLMSRSMATLIFISVAMLLLYFFMGLFDFWRSRVLVRVADEFEGVMTSKTFTPWLRQSTGGGAAARAQPMSDISTLRQFLSGPAPGTFFDLPWAPLFILLIFFLHWTLGVLAVIGSAIIFTSAWISSRRTEKPMMESLKLRRAEQAFAGTAQRNAEAIQAMGMGENVRARWAQFNVEGSRETVAAADRSGGASSFTKAFRMFLQSAMLGAGGALAIQQIISPGAMIAGSIILGRALAPVQMIIGQWRNIGQARDAYDRLNDFHLREIDQPQSTRLPDPTGHITVEGLTAGPPGAQKAVLSGLNFSVQPGQGLGVIGPSASGKSTLARLLVGVWMPQRGSVRLDGATFDQWDRETVGRHIGYLPQMVELFDGTISENIARFDPAKTDESVVTAAKWAGVHDLILRLPAGYETQVGIGRSVLSGGQTQRIGLARALYGSPKLIVLDEPNANLDHEGDQALTKAIATAKKKGASVIVMAHRPSAIAAVDLILSLRDGKQEAFGPKDEVLAALRGAMQEKKAAKAKKSKPSKPAISPISLKGTGTGPLVLGQSAAAKRSGDTS
ncbi:type I secretion system ATP-binding protein PrsD [Algimonas ampicilliniresistens]|uniref:Type I secretion system ATP-binding protein PrsD n=1 Tax=Algimonas ampicilliniresistens TaxID=1298735 RepID=A0ABQ5VDA1_9PROT|nr:type I secretion system permease/ATPase [Algimonas ampicilliniresistens]GLQ24674.1 type I secretion system ATP-binding protein PrsD [Algimonas ampicilliniresistens]